MACNSKKKTESCPTNLFPVHTNCDTGCGQSSPKGWSKSDGFYQICINGSLMVGISTTDEGNFDSPFDGSAKSPPTHILKSLGGWISGALS